MPFRLPRLLPALGRREAPPPEEHLPAVEESRLPLHVLAHDAKLSIARGRLVVATAETCERLCLDDLSQVVLHGGARVTVPTLQALARAGVPLVLLSHRGYYLGQTVDLSGATAAARRAQYRVAEDPRRRLALARDLICAKLTAAARLARRRAGAKAEVTAALDRAARAAGRARGEATLRGIEGAAAAAWYGAWPGFLKRDDPLCAFDGRSRRPPRDAVNALLSYLYAVTTGMAASAVSAAGLDPAVGLYHAERPGRPALALDLVEPFRVDGPELRALSVALSAVIDPAQDSLLIARIEGAASGVMELGQGGPMPGARVVVM